MGAERVRASYATDAPGGRLIAAGSALAQPGGAPRELLLVPGDLDDLVARRRTRDETHVAPADAEGRRDGLQGRLGRPPVDRWGAHPHNDGAIAVCSSHVFPGCARSYPDAHSHAGKPFWPVCVIFIVCKALMGTSTSASTR